MNQAQKQRGAAKSLGGEYEAILEIMGLNEIHPFCVDFGARLDGSNVAQLIANHCFDGILIDRQERHIGKIRELYPEVASHALLVTPENCNDFVPEDVGVLSIDIDGNDYHVWKAVKNKPQIVIIEMGSKLKGKPDDWIPEYLPDSPKRFDGASKEALEALGREKGYTLYKQLGVNLVFVDDALHTPAQTKATS